MANLQMSLKKKWFEMTKAGIKTEDYREINTYWFNRIFEVGSQDHFAECFENNGGCIHVENLIKKFDFNVMTLGYPKSGDKDKIITLEHKGIEIRTGKPEWGAEPGRIYFVIKHGKIIQ